ncbi:nuclear transport factor 2 family protein [Micromonospora sp. NPDC092111]|uniref:nuclear transport factor 2 family protein n=1 Tax=Micromonospora sp. NPDC092111 TaxID=3364289 RepID=UPI0037FFCD9C
MTNTTQRRPVPPPRSPREVFLALIHGVADNRWEALPELYAEETYVVHPFDPLRGPALRSREELRRHFQAASGATPRLVRRPADIIVHETVDPEVVIGQFAYQGTLGETGERFATPGIFVLRVRNGEIVSSHDYLDHLTSARVRGHLDPLVDAVRATTLPA